MIAAVVVVSLATSGSEDPPEIRARALASSGKLAEAEALLIKHATGIESAGMWAEIGFLRLDADPDTTRAAEAFTRSGNAARDNACPRMTGDVYLGWAWLAEQANDAALRSRYATLAKQFGVAKDRVWLMVAMHPLKSLDANPVLPPCCTVVRSAS
jgi:hypothetical protein